jgi:S-layer protein (TIGR01567 family)
MKKFTFAVVVLLLSAMAASAVNSTEVRSTVAEVVDGATFEWYVSNFPGFYYDIDDNLGTEKITMTITDGNVLAEDTGILYRTEAQANDFDFEDWGEYMTIGFLAEEYFAAYVDGSHLAGESYDSNLMKDEQLSKVLIDDDSSKTFTSGTPLKLNDGYALEISNVDSNTGRVYVRLMKNGAVVHSAVIEPSKYGATLKDKTYVYKKDMGDTEKIVVIAVYFKNVFRGAETDLATVNGIWQISDIPTSIEVDTEYDKMTIQMVDADAMTITMSNEDNKITLTKNKDILLMENIRIKTADQDATAERPLRFYLYKEITEPGTYEIRGTVKDIGMETVEWDVSSFAGFYYDIDDNLGNEKIMMTITEGNVLAEDTGVVYTTEAQIKDFNFHGWGTFYTMAFMGNPYFAGYIDDMTSTHILSEATTSNLLSSGLLNEILLDDSTSMVVASGETVELSEGYALRPTIGIDDKGILVELLHSGVEIDSMAILPPFTYVYSTDLGKAKGVPIIAAHFLEPVSLGDRSFCKIDGLWQISDQPLDVEEGMVYDKMTVQSVNADAMTIMMNNEDNKITLTKKLDVSLMENIRIKTADQDAFWEDPLRFFIYQTVTVSGSGELI